MLFCIFTSVQLALIMSTTLLALRSRISIMAEQLQRGTCTSLELGGIKDADVPNLQPQLRLLFDLFKQNGHQVNSIDLEVISINTPSIPRDVP
jgi:hypothetical protein